jgi:hypothetical protein
VASSGNSLLTSHGPRVTSCIATVYGAALTARARPEGGLDIEVSFPG